MVIQVDRTQYKKKPQGRTIGTIKKRFTQMSSITDIPVPEVREILLNGGTVQPGVCPFSEKSRLAGNKGTVKSDFKSQQLFMVDVDNESASGCPLPPGESLQPQEAIKRLIEAGIIPCFWYPTFNYTQYHPRFRIAVTLSEPVTDPDKRDSIQRVIAETVAARSDGVDMSTADASRLFFGTDQKPENDFGCRIEATTTAEKVLSLAAAEEPKKRQQRERYTLPGIANSGERTKALISLAGSLVGKGMSAEAAKAAIAIENERICNPPLTDRELEREVFPALFRESWKENTRPYTLDAYFNRALYETVLALDPAGHPRRYGMNDAGNARLFMDACGDRIAYLTDRKTWAAYDGVKWNLNGESIARERLKQLADVLGQYAFGCIQDEDRKEKYIKHVAKWQNFAVRRTILLDAQSIKPVLVRDFDRDDMLLNFPEGTLNLETGELQAHRAEDMITMCTGAAYNPSAKCERWSTFLNEVMDNDRDTIRYLQTWAGYSLTGKTSREGFVILYGPTTRNGKSTFLETILKALGDYAAAVNPETFATRQNRDGSRPSEDIARMAGKRFVIVSEPQQEMELDAAKVKKLTGGNTITARNLNEGSFEFLPQCKIFFDTNHRPRINDSSVFASDRLHMIPFNIHFGPDQRDPELKKKLKTPENLSAVLNWCLAGWKAVQDNPSFDGVRDRPIAVSNATEDYYMSQDVLQLFLNECTERGDGYEIEAIRLHGAFVNWCLDESIRAIDYVSFMTRLEEKRIYAKKKRPAGTGREGTTRKMILGLRLVSREGG